MPHLHITPRRVAPYIISGATGVHILTRMHRLSQQPATDIPFQSFLLKNTDVVLALGGASVVIWQLAKHKPRQRTMTVHSTNTTVVALDKSVITGIVHQLRQVFTALLLGLGLTEQKAATGQTQSIPNLVQRMVKVAREGIEAVNRLDADSSPDSHEREYGA